jgi:hypothetical protein
VRGITAGKCDGGWGMIGFDATRLSEQWDLLTKWLLLEWDRIQALPYGPLSAAWLGIDAVAGWISGTTGGLIVAGLLLAILTLRLLRLRR